MTSNINPSLPEDNVPAVKADLRANLQAAKDEIEALQGRQVPLGGSTGQVLKKLSSADFHFDWGTDEMGTGSGNFGDEVVLVDAQAGADDLAKINNAITAAKSSGKPLWFSKRHYNVDGKFSGLSGWDQFRWYGNGAVLRVGNGVSGTSGGGFLTFTNCSRFAIFDLILDGNNANRGTAENFSGHNCQILGGADFLFENVTSANACTDGWRVAATSEADPATYPKRGKWLNCIADNNGRVGLSFIESADMLVLGGQYSNQIHRQPLSGIDIEPNNGSGTPACTNITIDGALFFGNGHDAVHSAIGSKIFGTKILNCTIRNNGGLDGAASGSSQSHAAAIYVDGRKWLISGNHIFDNTAGNGSTLGVIFLPNSSAAREATITNNQLWNNLTGGAGLATSWGHIHSRGAGVDRELIIAHNNVHAEGSANPGIRLECDNNVVVGNRVIAGSGAAFTLSGAGNALSGNFPAP